MVRRTRAELEAENLVLYRELETIRDRLDELLEDDEALDEGVAGSNPAVPTEVSRESAEVRGSNPDAQEDALKSALPIEQR